MSELTIAGKAVTMSSLEIAELTGKPRNDVLKDIRRILADAGIGEGEFSLTYKSSQNKELPCYRLPRRECDLAYKLLKKNGDAKIASVKALKNQTNPDFGFVKKLVADNSYNPI